MAPTAPARDNRRVRRRPSSSRLRTAILAAALVVATAALTAACGGDGTDTAARPTTGKGIYLASENGKSVNYVGWTGTTGCMFLAEAALGPQEVGE